MTDSNLSYEMRCFITYFSLLYLWIFQLTSAIKDMSEKESERNSFLNNILMFWIIKSNLKW